MNAIETSGLTKVYGGRRVVDGLNMHVAQGDIYGFVGGNGAGKSTTMKMICGLIEPSEGSVSMVGADAAPKRGAVRMGSLIESPGLLGNLSAMDNLMIKAVGLGVRKPKAHCQELLEFVGLSQTGKSKAKGFSLGMRQRLGIALALVGNPDVLLLDEPFNGLDPAATRTMRTTLEGLNRTRGVTIVVSSHVLDQLNRFATCFGVISDGRMVSEFDGSQLHSLGQTAVRVRTADMAGAYALLRRALPRAEFAQEDRGTLLVSGTDAHLERISQLLFAGGQQVIELTPIERDIEDFFLDLMKSDRKRKA